MTDHIPAEDIIRERAIRGGRALDLASGDEPRSASEYGADFDRWRAFLRPEPSEDERAVRWLDDEKVMASVLEAWTGAWVDRRPSLLELILAAGFRRA